MGGHTKAAFALAVRGRSILGQHLGDLGSRRARNVYLKELQSYQTIYGLDLSSSITCCDAHPTYDSTALALERVGRVKTIYHHEAHLESLITERGFKGDALGVVCDGSGLGTDGGMWGGEFFLIQDKCRKRIGSLMPFRLPGGERAIREPKRSAFGMLHATYGDASASDPFVLREFNDQERVLIAAALRQEINAPRTTSLGRLFDGLAALLGICTLSDYEAQAPMAMEALAHGAPPGDPLPVTWVQDESGLWQWDWRGLVSAARENEGRDADRRKFAAAFHATIVQVVYELAQRFKVDTILLTGGVFQNAVLVELCQKRLRAAGMSVITHQLIPPGDGGLAIGQIAVECMGEREHVSRNSG